MYVRGDIYFIQPSGKLMKLSSVYSVQSLLDGLHEDAVCANLEISKEGNRMFWLNGTYEKEMMNDVLFPEIITAMKKSETQCTT